MQRLHGIHQLGLAHLVFPGANHTRLEHSLGTYHIASKLCSSLEIDPLDQMEVRAAAMLHDIGHTPFSHTLEEVIHHRLGKDHMDISRDIIVGDYMPYKDRDTEVVGSIPPLPDVLRGAGLDPERVADLVTSARRQEVGQSILMVDGEQAHFGQNNFLKQIISGPLDVDQMDYLLRDAYYTGVAHGTIDVDRLFQTLMVHHGNLVVDKSGLVAVEGLMVARSLMYTSVYFHKTVRIAEMMMCKAVEAAPPGDPGGPVPRYRLLTLIQTGRGRRRIVSAHDHASLSPAVQEGVHVAHNGHDRRTVAGVDPPGEL